MCFKNKHLLCTIATGHLTACKINVTCRTQGANCAFPFKNQEATLTRKPYTRKRLSFNILLLYFFPTAICLDGCNENNGNCTIPGECKWVFATDRCTFIVACVSHRNFKVLSSHYLIFRTEINLPWEQWKSVRNVTICSIEFSSSQSWTDLLTKHKVIRIL